MFLPKTCLDATRKPEVTRFKAVYLLNLVVSAYTLGGPGVPHNRRVQRLNRVISLLQQQKAAVRKQLLVEAGDKVSLVRREAAQFGLSLLLQVFESFPNFAQLPLESQLSCVATANSWSPESFVKKAKAVTCYPFARYWKQELPDVPNPDECRSLAFKGPCRKWIRNLFVSHSSKNTRFFWGLLQGVKRGCAPINEEFISEAFEKHKKALTKPYQGTSSNLAFTSNVCKEVLKGVSTKVEFPKAPSISASYRSTRQDGGKLAEIRSIAKDGVIGVDPISKAFVEGSMDLSPQEARDHYLNSTDRKLTRVEMIVEPLKARPITAGHGLGSWIGMIGQRNLHDHLRQFQQFSLTGEPLSEDHLKWVDAMSPKEFDKWVSGDYSAATDNLDISQTKAIFEAYLSISGFDDEMKVVMREMLYEQVLHYKSHDDSQVEQTNGQLMGSPLSFPVLCLANFSAYSAAWLKYFGKLNFKDWKSLPVLINGDDILFKANEQFYRIWQGEVEKFGFTLSIGKSYFSKDFLTVNSMLFLCQVKDNATCFTQVGFFNPAQVLPRSYIVDHKADDFADDFSSRLSDALQRALDPGYAFGMWTLMNRSFLQWVTCFGQVNLFIHQKLGGLGVKPPEKGLKVWATDKQLKLAHLCRRKPGPVVRLKPSSKTEGFMNLRCATRRVVATCEPPSRCQPTFLNNYIVPLQRIWKVSRRRLPRKEPKLPLSECATNPWIEEITPCVENNRLFQLHEAFHQFGVPCGTMIGGSRDSSTGRVKKCDVKVEVAQVQE